MEKTYRFPLLEAISDVIHNKKHRVIVISGPTACGKTSLSLDIAKKIGGEIISADSMQVYRGMDIGTAKVSLEERKQVPHHLIDICNIKDNFNVIDFYCEAQRALQDILSRGKVPIVVGGTGFYLHALLYGPPAGPSPDYKLRRELERLAFEQGMDFLYSRLKELDPEYASKITNRDRQKTIRALEIIQLTGNRVSSLKNRRHIVNYNYQCWFIYRPRDILYKMVEKRCDEMIKDGFINEAKVMEKGLCKNRSASQSIGYRQCLDFLKTDQSEEDLNTFVTNFKTASRHYVKKQFTWFRKEPLFKWLNIEGKPQQDISEHIIAHYYNSF